MAVLDLYHKRRKRGRGDKPDVFTYEDIPKALRVQVVQVMHEVLGEHEECHGYLSNDHVYNTYKELVRLLRKEFAVFRLPPTDVNARESYVKEITNFLLFAPDHEHFLSALELTCQMMEYAARSYNYRSVGNSSAMVDSAISEINTRFKEYGVGYEYIASEMIRIDDLFVHNEAVRPTLIVLSSKRYAGAEQEFLKAHQHYRKGNTKEALVEALKALESVMKVICAKRGWAHSPTDTVAKLINICFTNGLVPAYLQSHFSALRATLESGVPTVRNKQGGHGQGERPIQVPEYLAAYVLHMTASAIVFLTRAEEKLP